MCAPPKLDANDHHRHRKWLDTVWFRVISIIVGVIATLAAGLVAYLIAVGDALLSWGGRTSHGSYGLLAVLGVGLVVVNAILALGAPRWIRVGFALGGMSAACAPFIRPSREDSFLDLLTWFWICGVVALLGIGLGGRQPQNPKSSHRSKTPEL